MHALAGQVPLLGVEQSESTSRHLAESLAKVPYSVSHPCVVEIDGVAQTVMIAETDHCCGGFRRVDEWLIARGLLREGRVGSAHARLTDARALVAEVVERLTNDPLGLHEGDHRLNRRRGRPAP